jgi:probable phosphoglycerate mutase
MLLYLARHAQTASSAVDSFNGHGELPLTEHGREQAKKLGARLAGIQWAAVYRSPLGRAKETAELIAPGVASLVLQGLIEIDYGGWEGLTPEQARALNPGRYKAWIADPDVTSPTGGETAALRILAAALTGAPIAKYRTRWAQDECALNLVELRAGKEPYLRLWNDTSHLGQDPGATTRAGK